MILSPRLPWSQREFDGKSILDIGVNSGYYALIAKSLGAEKVISVECSNNKHHVPQKVSCHYNVGIVSECVSVAKLDRTVYSADIVLVMGDLNELVDNLVSYKDIVFKIAELTLSSAYIEIDLGKTSWSVSTRNKDSQNQCTVEQLIAELNKYYKVVQVISLVDQKLPDSEGVTSRLLIKATEKNEEVIALRELNDLSLIDLSLQRGSNSVKMLTSKQGAYVLKELPNESILPKLQKVTQNELFDHFGNCGCPLLPPVLINEKYVVTAPDNRSYMLFPFIGNFSNYFPERIPPAPVVEPLALAVMLRKTFKSIPDSILDEIDQVSAPINLRGKDQLGNQFNEAMNDVGLGSLVDDIYCFFERNNEFHGNTLVHNDLQLGNMVHGKDSRDWIIDMDIMRLGTPYSDFICCAIFNNCSVETLEKYYRELVRINDVDIKKTDLYFSLKMIFSWIETLHRYHKDKIDRFINPTVSGIKTVTSLFDGGSSNKGMGI